MGLAEPVWACLVQRAASAASARRQSFAERDISGCGTAVPHVALWGLKLAKCYGYAGRIKAALWENKGKINNY